MKTHFGRKTLCCNINDFANLSDEIKMIVLKDRKYHISKDSILQLDSAKIINYNQINYMINTQMSSLELVEKYMRLQNKSTTPIDEFIEEQFSNDLSLLGNSTNQGLKIDDFYEDLDSLSNVQNHHENINLLYDSKEDKINYFEDDGWVSMISDKGLKIIYAKLQEYKYDYYECNLIEKIVSLGDCQEQQQLLEIIDEYYQFICAFDLNPYVYNRKDYDLLKNEKNETLTNVTDRFYERFIRIKRQMKLSHKKQIMKKSLHILKRNTNSISKFLKSHLLDIFQTEDMLQTFVHDSTR